MVDMKLTGYLNLKPEDIILDPENDSLSISREALRWRTTLYPTQGQAEEFRAEDRKTFQVAADIPDGSLFETSGEIDQTEGREGRYVAGIFTSFKDAFNAADKLGTQGQRGDVNVLLSPPTVFDSLESWKNQFDKAVARTRKTAENRKDPLHLVKLVQGDEARASMDPGYAVWLRLDAKYGAKS